MEREPPPERPAKPRRGLNPFGATARRNKAWHDQERRYVKVTRAGGRCEYVEHGERCAKHEGIAWHHVVGRHNPEEPWCSWRHLTVALCPDHHRAVHVSRSHEDDLVVRGAIVRLVLAYPDIIRWSVPPTSADPSEFVRSAVRTLKAHGVDPRRET